MLATRGVPSGSGSPTRRGVVLLVPSLLVFGVSFDAGVRFKMSLISLTQRRQPVVLSPRTLAHFHSAAPALPTYVVPGSKIRTCWLNFGPQHPAAHGIVRLNMQMHGEVLTRVDPQFGLLHRGTEKLVETRTTTQALPYFDRFDYVANLFQEHVYCLAVESLGRTQYTTPSAVLMVRVLFDELSRVLNHLLTLSATSLDLSAMGPIF